MEQTQHIMFIKWQSKCLVRQKIGTIKKKTVIA